MAWQCIAQAVNEVGGAAKVPKDVKKWSDLKLQSKNALSSHCTVHSASCKLLLHSHFIGHRCIGIINMRGSKLFHNVYYSWTNNVCVVRFFLLTIIKITTRNNRNNNNISSGGSSSSNY